MPRTAEEIAAEIEALEDELDELVPDAEPEPTQPPPKPARPAPDPKPTSEIDSDDLVNAIAEAEEAGNLAEASRLKVQLAKKLGASPVTDEDVAEVAELDEKIAAAEAKGDFGPNTTAWKTRRAQLRAKGSLTPDGIPIQPTSEEGPSVEELQAAISEAEAAGDFKQTMQLKVALTRKVFGR